MNFCVHGSVLGSVRHLWVDGENLTWAEELPVDGWVYSKDDVSQPNLRIAFEVCGAPLELSPPERFAKAIGFLRAEENIPWEWVMPKERFREYVREVVARIQQRMGSTDLSYYRNVYRRTSYVLEALRPARINKRKYAFLTERNIQGVNPTVIESFCPDEAGFAARVVYNQRGTMSGRMTVESGPQILTLNKELKSIVKSRYKGGKVYQFDYVSLEPRIALKIAGIEPGPDVYSDINAALFGGSFPRNVVKEATLSILYGSGAQSISDKTGIDVQVCRKEVLPALKKYFNVLSIIEKLSKEFQKDKLIRNYFGRAIYALDGAPHKLYNHFIQSTAVDVACLGFFNIVNSLTPEQIPLFIIHDNLLVDTPSGSDPEEIMQNGAEIDNMGRFYLEYAPI